MAASFFSRCMYRRPRGTRDWLPEEAFRKRFVEGKLREVFEKYGYGEIITPAFESLDLLVAKAGEEVKEQIYWFKDKGGRSLGLRFELTTPVARVVAARPDMPKPIRFYYIQPVWRYEEPQKGRYREFWQAGIELMGVSGPEGDAEVIAVTDRALRNAGLEGFEIRVSDRRIVEDILAQAGVPAERMEEAFRVLDKLEKKGREFVVDSLVNLGVKREDAESILDSLTEGGLDISVEGESGRKGLAHLKETLDLLKEGYGVEAIVDYSIVRGLGYYTGLVFEVKVEGAGGSVAGGGRYDNLISTVGGGEIAATGMAIGIERLLDVLGEKGVLPAYKPLQGVIIPVKSEKGLLVESIRIAEMLRSAGFRCTVEYGRSLRKALEKAASVGARYAIIVGPRDLKEGRVTVRDLEEWREEKVGLEELTRYLTA